MERIGFILKVKEDKIEEYKRRHANVWPEMLDALRETGWHNYTLFMREDGLLFGYVEKEVNARWQAEMGELFESLEGQAPDEAMKPLEIVFHLD